MTPPFVGVKMENTRDLAVLLLCPRSCDPSHYAHIGSLTLGGACQCSLITPSSVQRVTLQVCFYFISPAAAFLSQTVRVTCVKMVKGFYKKNIPFIMQECICHHFYFIYFIFEINSSGCRVLKKIDWLKRWFKKRNLGPEMSYVTRLR